MGNTNIEEALGKSDVSVVGKSVMGMGLNDMKWREKDHLNVDGIKWNAQSM